jgi:hypothetical protein
LGRVKIGYGVSMLKHLAEGFPDAVAKLTMQYRMNEDICHLSNLIGARMNPYDIVYNAATT